MANTAANATAMQLPAVDTGATVFVTLGYLCLLLGVIFLAFWLMKRLGFQGMGAHSSKGGPQLLSRLMLGNRQSVAVVRYRDKDLVLGVTEERINLIKEFDAADSAEDNVRPRAFASLLKRSTENEG